MDIHGRTLTERMVEMGHCVSIISTRHPRGIDYEKKNGVSIYYLKNTVFGSRRKGWPGESVNQFYELHYDKPFDIILSQSFDAFGITCLDRAELNIPVMLVLHGTIYQELKTFSVNIRSALRNPRKTVSGLAGMFFSYFMVQRPLLRFSDRIITVSREVSNDTQKWYGKKTFQKCVTILNGVNTAVFKPDIASRMAVRHELGLNDTDTVLLTLGKIVHEKGHHIAIEALKILKERKHSLKLLVVGEGEKRHSLEKLADGYGLGQDVIFIGEVDNSKTVHYYNSADIFLMTTLRREGLPFVLLEAMACAKPVIASRIGGNITVIEDHENGLLIEPGDVVKTADNIQMLLEDPGMSARLSTAARKCIVEAFSADQMVDLTLQEMKTLVRDRL